MSTCNPSAIGKKNRDKLNTSRNVKSPPAVVALSLYWNGCVVAYRNCWSDRRIQRLRKDFLIVPTFLRQASGRKGAQAGTPAGGLSMSKCRLAAENALRQLSAGNSDLLAGDQVLECERIGLHFVFADNKNVAGLDFVGGFKRFFQPEGFIA